MSDDQAETTPTTDAPGWYADPLGQYVRRYRSADGWTARVQLASGETVDLDATPIPAAPPTAAAPVPAGMITCPYCHTAGSVTVKDVKKKAGISGGKATAAVLTVGFSVLATGLSRKEKRQQLKCSQCGVSWLA